MTGQNSPSCPGINLDHGTIGQQTVARPLQKLWSGLIAVSFLAFASSASTTLAADKPENIATDFCKAVAAQARCVKVFTMPRDTEARLEKLAGDKLRGDGEALNGMCQGGNTQFYSLEDAQGKDKACQTALREFGPDGSRRAGLVVSREAPSLKLPEAEVAQITTDLCYAMSVAEFCPGVSLSTGINDKLSTDTGADLSRPGVGYFSSECGSGTFRAGLARGKVKLAAFCATGLATYGKNGTKRDGLLTGFLPSTASDSTGKSKPSENDQSTDVARIILTEVPPLADGQTPEDLFGKVPATYSRDQCEQIQTSVLQAHTRFTAASSLDKEVRAAIHLKAGSLAAAALCPNSTSPGYEIGTALKVKETGLEACHLVLETTKEIDKLSKRFRSDKFLRGVLAVSETRVWALTEFTETCSELTKRRMESALKFAEQSLQRDQGNINCRIWSDAFRGTMKEARKFQSAKNWKEAFAIFDGKAAGAIHGMTAACEQASYADNATKQWVSSRQYLQQQALR